MGIAELIRELSEINQGFSDDYIFNEQFEETWKSVCERCKIDSNALCTSFGNIIDKDFSPDITIEWNYIISSIGLFYMLIYEFEKSPDEVCSVQQTKCLKKYFENLVHIGICSKLLPNLPVYAKPTETYDNGDIFYNYQILKTTTLALCDFLKYPKLRLIILPQYLRPVLVACYQIAYCPLKKPSLDLKGCEKNAITEYVYNKLLNEKQQFEDILHQLQISIHPGIFVKETMGTFLSSAPPWFKKTVSQKLTSIIKSKNGVENIAIALLDGSTNDSNHTWKTLDILTKLILSCRSFPDFKENICDQIIRLLSKVSDDILVFERIYIHCTRTLYKTEPDLAKDVWVRPIVSYILYFTYRDHKFQENEDITNKIKQTIRLLHSLFVEENVELIKLPITLITPIINVLFKMFSIIRQTDLKSTCKDLNDLLESYLSDNFDNISIVYDSLLFDIPSDTILLMRKDISIAISDQDLRVNYNKHSISYSISESSDALLQVIKNKTDLRLKLFGYFLGCLVNKEKYFKKANDELMNIENSFMNDHLERSLVVYKNLADLAEDKDIQKSITQDPEEIIKYCGTVLNKVIELNTHRLVETDTEAYQTLFTILMVLQNLTNNCTLLKLEKHKNILEPLRKICQETSDKETKNIINEILDIVDKGTLKPTRICVEDVKTELEKALEDICDPLLPIRGHGLMTLAKLVEKKDKNVMERKQYVLNILKQNLKSDDSYIYLNAINGLSALADVFPDTVLNILCEEYSDTTKQTDDDGHEVRMKLGESLVRVTKILGEMAPKYKTLLLNTFLNGVRDEDDLIRTSSLSNLGEVCRVLGYNLGTIITEVLVCVHSVISTDKSPQARRAAVTILRQLFVGLEAGMIAFLKEDILPIYRTLKQIYNNDEDDVMRLQAQLALEELNENMKNFVLPNFKLHDEKKVIMLN